MTPWSNSTPASGLHHSILGTFGPGVVLLHGLFGQGKNWTTVARQLAARHRVLLVDLPNHGRSSWTDHVAYEEMAGAIGDLVQTEFDAPVAVIGHSMGGKVAMALALLRPRLVQRLVVVDISPVPYQRMSSFGSYVAGLRSVDLRTLTDRTQADDQLRAYVPDAVIRSFLLQNLRRGPRADDPGDDRRWHWQMNLELLGDSLGELGDWPDLHRPPYEGPVLWLAGQHSDYVLPGYAAAMRTLFPRTQLVTVKNAGHWVHSEQPEIFLDAVGRFVHPEGSNRQN